VATVAGNLFELKQVSGLRLLDLALPEAFVRAYQGPQFGIAGTRAGVEARPIIGTIVKPSVGLSADATAGLVRELAPGGIDFIKDDELQADGPHCPFEDRARAVMAVLDEHAQRTGRKVMYAFNLTGELDQMRRRHDLVAALGGTCVMASLNSVGLVGMVELRRHCRLPIHAHRNGWGQLGRHPLLGWSYVAWAKLWRLAGADHMHVNGLRNKFCEDDDSVVASARSCLSPMWADKPCTVMPVLSSGQSVLQVDDTWKAIGSLDLIHAAGGGIMAHPSGIGAGVRSLRLAWEAAVAGVPRDGLPAGRLLAYYGDDFTGSTDVMEVMTFAGLPTVLLFDVPSPAQLARFAACRGIGIAGVARGRSPAWMDEHLPAVFRFLASLEAPIVQHKVRSTFDSSPAVGSIGRAIELGQALAGGSWSPLVVAAPRLRRYQMFGNLFAAADGSGCRLDRHPTMAPHPVTPMGEADLRRHLARQTERGIGLVGWLALRDGSAARRLREVLAEGAEIVLLDVLDEATLAAAGRLVWEERGARLFAASSSSLQYALVAWWREAGLLPAQPALAQVGAADRIVVASGSCSPVSAGQIAWGEGHGFETVRLDVERLLVPTALDAEIARATDAALAMLARGGDPVVLTAKGPDDPALARFEEVVARDGLEREAALVTLDTALGGADVVLMAVPDALIGKIAKGFVAKLEPGCAVIMLDAAAPHAGELPTRADITYFVTHPCHPPLFKREASQAAHDDYFGGIAAGQAIVCALMQGPEAHYALCEAIAKAIYKPVLASHRVTVEQLAILEPALSETIGATLVTALKDATTRPCVAACPRAPPATSCWATSPSSWRSSLVPCPAACSPMVPSSRSKRRRRASCARTGSP